MVKYMLPDTPIRKVQMSFSKQSDYSNAKLLGFRFFDEKDALIFEIGQQERHFYEEVLLAEDERIVGFTSRAEGATTACHYNFRLMIAKLI